MTYQLYDHPASIASFFATCQGCDSRQSLFARLRRLPFLDLPRGLCFSDARQWLPFTQIFAPEKAKYLAEEALIVLLFSVLLLASIDVDNIIVSSQFLLEVIFSPSSSILKWCSINADSSSRPILFFIRRAAGRPSFSSFVVPPGDHLFLLLWRRRATIHFFISCAARRLSISSFIAPPGANPYLHSSRRRAPIHFFIGRAAGHQSIISSFFAPLGANPYYLPSSRRRAPIHYISTPRAAGRPSISSFPRAAGRLAKSNLFQFANGRSSRIIAPTGQSSRIIPPTGDYQQSLRRRVIINNHCADM